MRLTKAQLAAMPEVFTVAYLSEMEACSTGIDTFRRVFPNGARLTAANIRKAIKAELNPRFIAALPDLGFFRLRINDLRNKAYDRAYRDSRIAGVKSSLVHARRIDKAVDDATVEAFMPFIQYQKRQRDKTKAAKAKGDARARLIRQATIKAKAKASLKSKAKNSSIRRTALAA